MAFLLFFYSAIVNATTTDFSASADSKLVENASSTNYGTDTYFETYPWTGASATRRGLVAFDLSSIPSGSTITSATLKLMTTSTYGNTRTIAAHRATSSWTEGTVTWSNFAAAFNGTATATASVSWSGSHAVRTFDVTTDVAAFVAGTSSNYGWLIKDNGEDNSQAYWGFGTKENGTSANRPVLTVVYTLGTVWDGGGTDNNWTTAANWTGDIATASTYDVYFAGSTRLAPSNDFAAATSFKSINFNSGSGAFVTSGNSTTITGGSAAIAANNTSGTVTIGHPLIFGTAAPTISVASGGTLAISSTIANGGYLITNSSVGTTSISGVISGTGGYTKSGAGTTTLSADNTFTGTTTVSAGTLQLGSGSTTGTVASTSIVNNSALIINRSNSISYTGVISGTGTFEKLGAGTLTLSGTNTYTGTTTISAGALTLGASEVISNSSNLVMLTGTTLNASYTETMGTIKISSGGPKIYLGSGNHTVSFAASAGVTWAGGNYLYIYDWTGGYNGTAAGGSDPKIFIGSGNNVATDLTAAQLAKITFYRSSNSKYYTATQLSTGEVVPTSTLPVELVEFNGEKVAQDNFISWSTASEINSNYFELWRSEEGVMYEKIATISAAGTSNSIKNYSFQDKEVSGMHYYKLIQYDFDGSHQESKVIIVSGLSNNSTKVTLYPVPSSNHITVSAELLTAGTYYVKIYDSKGSEVYHSILMGLEGENKFPVNISELTAGNYYLKIFGSNDVMLTAPFIRSEN